MAELAAGRAPGCPPEERPVASRAVTAAARGIAPSASALAGGSEKWSPSRDLAVEASWSFTGSPCASSQYQLARGCEDAATAQGTRPPNARLVHFKTQPCRLGRPRQPALTRVLLRATVHAPSRLATLRQRTQRRLGAPYRPVRPHAQHRAPHHARQGLLRQGTMADEAIRETADRAQEEGATLVAQHQEMRRQLREAQRYARPRVSQRIPSRLDRFLTLSRLLSRH